MVILLLAQACNEGGRARAIDYAREHATELVASSRLLWLNERFRLQQLTVAEYPGPIRELNPNLVNVGPNGVMIYVRTVCTHVTGVFVRCDPSYIPPGMAPPDSPDPSTRGSRKMFTGSRSPGSLSDRIPDVASLRS